MLRRPPFDLDPLSRPALSKFSRPMRPWPFTRDRQLLPTCHVRGPLIVGSLLADPARAPARTDIATAPMPRFLPPCHTAGHPAVYAF
jgi:hypothetical protein